MDEEHGDVVTVTRGSTSDYDSCWIAQHQHLKASDSFVGVLSYALVINTQSIVFLSFTPFWKEIIIRLLINQKEMHTPTSLELAHYFSASGCVMTLIWQVVTKVPSSNRIGQQHTARNHGTAAGAAPSFVEKTRIPWDRESMPHHLLASLPQRYILSGEKAIEMVRC